MNALRRKYFKFSLPSEFKKQVIAAGFVLKGGVGKDTIFYFEKGNEDSSVVMDKLEMRFGKRPEYLGEKQPF